MASAHVTYAHLICLMILSASVTQGLAVSVRGQMRAQRIVPSMRQSAVNFNGLHANPTYQVLNKSSLTVDAHSECLCNQSQFWHWRVHSCIDQGPWGYECGFFPGEHHHRVCRDGLACKRVQGARDTYVSHGKYQGTANSFPASCVACTAEDECLNGTQRHAEECLKEYVVDGEACATVRVILPVSAQYTATASHTASATVEKQATAQAHAKVNQTAVATATSTAESNATVEANATAEESREKEAAANATRSFEATAEGSANSTQTAVSDILATAQATECFPAAGAKELLGFKEDARFSAVLAAKVVSAADMKAFELAAEKARKRAQEQGLVDAQEAAKQVAAAEAANRARLEAEALAREAAAWKAEAGANKKALQAAEARAGKLAEEAAKAEANRAAHLKAQAEAAKATAAAASANAKAKAEAAAKNDVANDANTLAKEAADAAAQVQAQADDAVANAAEVQAQADDAVANAAEAAQNLAELTAGFPARKGAVKPAGEVSQKNTLRKISEEDSRKAMP